MPSLATPRRVDRECASETRPDGGRRASCNVSRSLTWVVGAAMAFAAASCAHAVCTAPPALQAKVLAQPDAQTYAELGTWYGGQQEFDCASDAFRSAWKLDPDSGPIAYMLGLTLYSGGHAEDAVAPLQLSAGQAPDDFKVHVLLGATLSQLNRIEEAKTQWEMALKLDSKSTIAVDGLAKCLIAEGDYASVIDHLRSSPDDQNLTLDLATAYSKMGMSDDAAATLEAGLKVFPGSVQLTGDLVSIRVQQTRYQDASALAQQTAESHPSDLAAQALYLRVLVLNGDRALAAPLAKRLLAASPHDFDFLYLSGVLEREAGDYAAARAHLEEAVALNPGYYNVHFNLGAVLSKLGDPKSAREQFEKAIELGATEPEIRFDLAGVLRTLGETQLAQEQLKLYQQEVKDRASRTLAANKSGEAALDLANGDAKKAAALYQEAFDAMPQNALLAYKLSVALDRSGDIPSERTALEQAIKIDPTLALAQNQLGYLDSQGGDAAAAEGHFRLALQAAPNYIQAWISLAATLGIESRFPEAQDALANALKLDPENSQALELGKALTAAQAQR